MVWRNWYTNLHTVSSILDGSLQFSMLSARALPTRGNLAEDLMYVAADAAKKLRGASLYLILRTVKT